MADASAPTTKATAVFGPSPLLASETPIAIATITTNTASQRYSALRNAAAPSWTLREIPCIFSSPASFFMMDPYLEKAKPSARRARAPAT